MAHCIILDREVNPFGGVYVVLSLTPRKRRGFIDMWYLRRIAGVTRVCWTYADPLNGRDEGSPSAWRSAGGRKVSKYGGLARRIVVSQLASGRNKAVFP